MAFNLGMVVDLCMICMPMLILMTLTLMQGHSGLAKEKISVELSRQPPKGDRGFLISPPRLESGLLV